MNKKYLVYKITNLLDNKIYIGAHATYNVNDKYMGSGRLIKEAIKKEGRKSFIKEILFEFDTKEEMLAKEKELVTKEFCIREDTYNRIEGGGIYTNLGMVTVRDKDGNCMNVYQNDPRWLSGELLHMNCGKRMSLKTKQAILNANLNRIIEKETRNKISETLKSKYAAGEKIGGIGSKRTEEYKNEASNRRKKDVIEGKDKRCKKIKQLDMNDNLIKIWDSIGQAANENNFKKGGIILVCKKQNNRTSAYNYKWEYA